VVNVVVVVVVVVVVACDFTQGRYKVCPLVLLCAVSRRS